MKAVRDNRQSASLPSGLGLGHILKYAPVALTLGALHLTCSDAPFAVRGNVAICYEKVRGNVAICSVPVRDNRQSAALPSGFGLGHILKYAPIALTLGALHLICSDAPFTVRDNRQSAALPSGFGLGHILKYAPVALTLGALHLTCSDAPLWGGVDNLAI